MKQSSQVVEITEDELNGDHAGKGFDFDKILRFEIGEFGPFQILAAISMGLVSAYGGMLTLNFVFGAAVPDHRCFVPACEQIGSSDFSAEWLKYAIPHKDGVPDPCSRYEYIAPLDPINGTCGASNFNQSNVISCDSFVTKNNQHSLATHINLFCTGQDQKLTLLGTASTLGRFIATPVSGILADKFGRLITVVMCALLGGFFSALQALPASLMSIELYWTFEFLASLLSTGMVGAGFIYNMEWTTSTHRVRLNSLYMMMDIFGTYAGVAVPAWYFAEHFLTYKLVLAAPGLLVLIMYFVFGESAQWLFSQNKHSKAIKSIAIAGRINGKPLQAHTIQQIENSSALTNKEKSIECDDETTSISITELLRERTLALRLVVVAAVWFCAFFAYYGVLFGSTNIHSNKYMSFLIVGLADIPGTIISTLLMSRIGRKLTIGSALAIYSVLLLSCTQVPSTGTIQLIMFFLSKTALSAGVIGMYTYSSEFWPTSIRGTAYSLGVSAARIGAIVASVSILLADVHVHLPTVLYSSAAVVGAVLIFAFLPETMHCAKLPDTIEEALDIGKCGENEKQEIKYEKAETMSDE